MADILIVDSVTAFWEDIIRSYKKKRGRDFVRFDDWGKLKEEWRRFTDWFINSPIHCIICGRAGWIYNEYRDEDGKDHLEKTGTKMKAENEFGYEPSFLLEMDRIKEVDPTSKIGHRIIHRAHVLKDRNDVLDGKSFDDPTFETFLPSINLLNLGGEHKALDTETTSEEMFESDGSTEWRKKEEQRQIAFEEFSGLMSENFPGTTGGEKLAKQRLCQILFGTTSGTAIQKKTKEEYERAKAQATLILVDSDNIQKLMEKGRFDVSDLNIPEPVEEKA